MGEPSANELAEGIAALGLDIGADQQQRLLDYLRLLAKWNKAYNLSAIRDPQRMVALHLLDSLSILPLVSGTRLLDVGTGAGLPGIPLAICRPELSVTLLDSNSKKTRFCKQVLLELGLANVRVEQARIEQLDTAETFDCITTRAFAELPRMLGWLDRLMQPETLLLAMKGVLPLAEIEQLRATGYRVDARHLQVPGVAAERHALLIRRSGLS